MVLISLARCPHTSSGAIVESRKVLTSAYSSVVAILSAWKCQGSNCLSYRIICKRKVLSSPFESGIVSVTKTSQITHHWESVNVEYKPPTHPTITVAKLSCNGTTSDRIWELVLFKQQHTEMGSITCCCTTAECNDRMCLSQIEMTLWRRKV